MLKTLGYFIKNVGEKAYHVLTQDAPKLPEHLGGDIPQIEHGIFEQREIKKKSSDNDDKS